LSALIVRDISPLAETMALLKAGGPPSGVV